MRTLYIYFLNDDHEFAVPLIKKAFVLNNEQNNSFVMQNSFNVQSPAVIKQYKNKRTLHPLLCFCTLQDKKGAAAFHLQEGNVVGLHSEMCKYMTSTAR